MTEKHEPQYIVRTELTIYKGDWGNPVDKYDVGGTIYDPETGEWTFLIKGEANSEISSRDCIDICEERDPVIEFFSGDQLQYIHYDMLIK